ncbi:MAG TPA: response regulator [Gemmatimonadales bacterium]|nr:response regulator [Gemmatimonadales bacterium]
MPAGARARASVLVLDDALFTRTTLAAQLRARDLDVELAESVSAAETVLAKRVPEVAIVDIFLERGPSGLDFVRRLRADPATQTMFIIAMSGHYVPDCLHYAQEVGCDRFLLKPYAVDLLIETIDQFLAGRRVAS